MRIDTSNPEIASALGTMAATIRANDGHVEADFTVRELDYQFSVAIDPRLGARGRIVLSYPENLRPPMNHVAWANESASTMTLAPTTPPLPPAQLTILEAWMTLVNVSGKATHAREHVPRYAVTDWQLRHHLSSAGYPDLRQPPSVASLRETVIAWHSASGRNKAPALNEFDRTRSDDDTPSRPKESRWRLIPLKCFVNHHPHGSNQEPVPGRVAVAAATPTGSCETFENYGDLDAMQLLMQFGYVEEAAPLVHSVPVEVELPHLGQVVVRWRAPRNPRAQSIARDIPHARPTEAGMEIRHLTARPGNRGRLIEFLSMAVQAHTGLSPTQARRESEQLIDAIAEANLTYYRRLDELVVKALARPSEPPARGFGTQKILPAIASMSLVQQRRLGQMWGMTSSPTLEDLP